MSFRPGIESANANGIRASVEAYPTGSAAIERSVREIAKFARAGSKDPQIKRLSYEALIAAGIDGRSNPSIRSQAEALLRYVQANTIYASDPAGVESIQSARMTLCVKGAFCLPIEDCDGLMVATASMMGSVGLPVYIVIQSFGRGHQPHTLVGIREERGGKMYCDPSTKKPIFTTTNGVVEEKWFDPLDEINSVGSLGPEFVSLGRPRTAHYLAGAWHEHIGGEWFRHDGGQWIGLGSDVSYDQGLGALCDQDSVLSYKRRLLPAWSSLKTDVEDCPGITLDQKTAFRIDYAAFNNWYTSEMPRLPFCGAEAIIFEGRDLEAKLNSWRRIITQLSCIPTSPELPPLSDDDPRSPNYKPPESETLKVIKAVATTAAIVAGAIGVTYGIYIAAPIVAQAASAGISAVRRKKVAA